ncbi:MAG: hypothetical protein IT298_17350 [Chloroflexi bacterium]|nr:hypothetical protein [Chloroflexota bacterium]RIK20109.1 MAG: hypothetical protein DCC53_11490 [Chloroflexota bacterium]
MSPTKHESHRHSTTVTLTLPDAEDKTRDGTILVQRGELARIHQFTYSHIGDLSEVIAEALIALDAVEADPPVIPEAPAAPLVSKRAAKPASTPTPSEPTVDVPLRKGTKAVRISHLKITAGDTDAAAYRQAVLLAGRLIDGKLWDGETPIRFEDVPGVARKMKYLTDGDFALFKLEDFVQIGGFPTDTQTDALL